MLNGNPEEGTVYRFKETQVGIPENYSPHPLRLNYSVEKEEIEIISSVNFSKNTSYSIYNTLGVLVKSGKLSNDKTINISQLPTSSYVLGLKIDSQIYSKMFLKSKN